MISRGLYIGGTALVQPDTLTNLPFRFNSGDRLLDLTDPLNPFVLAKGEYTFNLTFQLADAPAPPGGHAVVQFNIFDPTSLSPADFLDISVPGATRSMFPDWYCPAGTVVNAQALIRGCPDPKTFALTVGVQRVS